jgi:hypothetical protein
MRSQSALYCDKLLHRITLKADEEEPCVKLTSGGIDAISKGIAASQDSGAVIGRWSSHTDVCVRRNDGTAMAADQLKGHGIMLPVSSEGCATISVTTNHGFLIRKA